ncbi:MAG: glycosyltransferase family 4 protein [Marinilabiliaceae bacterium]|nr:glycosyltransferase family 4 protein [Marinilabiliaceae bacterium]
MHIYTILGLNEILTREMLIDMKIAIYSGEIPSTTFIEHLIRGVAKAGYEVVLFGRLRKRVNYNDKRVIIKNTPISPFFSILFVIVQGLLFLLRHFSDRSLLIKAMKEKEQKTLRKKLLFLSKVLPILNYHPDLFHIQWIKSGIEWDFLPWFGIKLIGSFRGSHITYTPIVNQKYVELYQQSFPRFTAFHAVSEDIAHKAVTFGADRSVIHVIPGAVSEELLNRVPSPKVNGSALKIISVGRFHWVKGYHFALDACKLLKDAGVEFTYTIIGGVGQEEIPFLRRSLGLEKEVKFVDHLSHNQLLSVLAEADVCLLPSVEEGIANIVLEAMALGVPVISTNCGGMSEVITNKVSGWLVSIRSSKAIYKAIIDYLNTDEVEREKMIENAREAVKSKHLLSMQIANMIRLYQKAMNVSPLDKLENERP